MHNGLTAYDKGLLGEQRALVFLQAQGMVLRCKRYRCAYGEIDLVMQDGEQTVCVEVKARDRGKAGEGLQAVTSTKQKRLIQAALSYQAQYQPEGILRFDVVEITAGGIIHLKNAFEA